VAQGPIESFLGHQRAARTGRASDITTPPDAILIIARIKHTNAPRRKVEQWYARIGPVALKSWRCPPSKLQVCSGVRESARTEGTWKPHAVNIDFNAPRTLTEGARTTIIG